MLQFSSSFQETVTLKISKTFDVLYHNVHLCVFILWQFTNPIFCSLYPRLESYPLGRRCRQGLYCWSQPCPHKGPFALPQQAPLSAELWLHHFPAPVPRQLIVALSPLLSFQSVCIYRTVSVGLLLKCPQSGSWILILSAGKLGALRLWLQRSPQLFGLCSHGVSVL